MDGLTRRDRQLLLALCHTGSSVAAARLLGVTPATAQNHLNRLVHRLATNHCIARPVRAAAALWALDQLCPSCPDRLAMLDLPAVRLAPGHVPVMMCPPRSPRWSELPAGFGSTLWQQPLLERRGLGQSGCEVRAAHDGQWLYVTAVVEQPPHHDCYLRFSFAGAPDAAARLGATLPHDSLLVGQPAPEAWRGYRYFNRHGRLRPQRRERGTVSASRRDGVWVTYALRLSLWQLPLFGPGTCYVQLAAGLDGTPQRTLVFVEMAPDLWDGRVLGLQLEPWADSGRAAAATPALSDHQLELLRCYAEHPTWRAVAQAMRCSEREIAEQAAALRQAWGVGTTLGCLVRAHCAGLLRR